jgi:G2/mitotic-specific cyclin 1/2
MFHNDKENFPPITVAPSLAAPFNITATFQTLVNEEEEPQDWDDLDAEDMGDPLMVSEYVQEIIQYMRQLEVNLIFG